LVTIGCGRDSEDFWQGDSLEYVTPEEQSDLMDAGLPAYDGVLMILSRGVRLRFPLPSVSYRSIN
jgi:hypothetical protein